jgi:general secretion pathway protein D
VNRVTKLLLVVLPVVTAVGCAGRLSYWDGREKVAAGRVEEGLKDFEAAVKADPTNAEYRAARAVEREKLFVTLLDQGNQALSAGNFNDAEQAFQRILNTDPAHARAQLGLDMLRLARRHKVLTDEAEAALKRNEPAEARIRIKQVLDENPEHRAAKRLLAQMRESEKAAAAPGTLNAAFRKPVTLEFRDTAMRSVFELLSRTSGINFMFDRDVRPDLRVTMFVRDTTVESAIRYILVTNQLELRVMDEKTVLIYPNTAAKARDYQELIVKTFYLGNVDAKQVLNLIRTIVKSRDIYVDDKLNTLVMRDTPDAIRLAQKLIATQDLAEPEVMLELEVLEIGTSKLQQLGITYPDTVAASVTGASGSAGSLTYNEARRFNSGLVMLGLNNPLLIANLKKTVTEQNLLANPRIRVRNREKAKVHIGEKVPVITTTVTANVGVSESVNYLDVGLKLEIEPQIYFEDEVAMKVGLEVSSILDTVTRSSGLQTYRLGTRNTATVLRLRDGETQILAGLIQKDERVSSTRIPGLGDIPLIGRLFSNQGDNNTRTEIVLLVTPRVIRNIARLPIEDTEFTSGTEGAAGSTALTVRPGGSAGTPSSMSTSPGQSAPLSPVMAPGRPAQTAPVTTAPPVTNPPGTAPPPGSGSPSFGPTFVYPPAPAAPAGQPAAKP